LTPKYYVGLGLLLDVRTPISIQHILGFPQVLYNPLMQLSCCCSYTVHCDVVISLHLDFDLGHMRVWHVLITHDPAVLNSAKSAYDFAAQTPFCGEPDPDLSNNFLQ
jgi:hypothetical protein